jgi:hypothetical protein
VESGEREISLKSSAKLRKSKGGEGGEKKGETDATAPQHAVGFQTKLSRRCQSVIREKFDKFVDKSTGLLMSDHFDHFAAIRQLFPADLGSDEEIGLMVDLMFPTEETTEGGTLLLLLLLLLLFFFFAGLVLSFIIGCSCFYFVILFICPYSYFDVAFPSFPHLSSAP